MSWLDDPRVHSVDGIKQDQARVVPRCLVETKKVLRMRFRWFVFSGADGLA